MKKFFLLAFACNSFFTAKLSAQCSPDITPPVIICPANIISNCNPAVTFSTPTATDNCGSGTSNFAYTGSVQTFVVPAGVTSLTIQGIGAAGGDHTGSGVSGGMGASLTGTFTVTPGETLYMMVGRKGGNTSNSSEGAAGGGGTFICRSSNFTTNLLMAAGGGGGAGYAYNHADRNANTSANGNNGYYLGYYGSGAGGTAGNGGGYADIGAAGAGWNNDGSNSGYCGSDRGVSPRNNGTGLNGCFGIVGGYGGGSAGYNGAGGGGGYSGGGGGDYDGYSAAGGGGGSFNGGTSPTSTVTNTGNGSVVITYSTPPTLTQIAGLSSGSIFPIGIDTITFVATDLAGNADTCSFTITVAADTTDPVITCPSNIVLTCDSVATFSTPTATDGCSTIGNTTFNYTGAVQTFVVPPGVTSLTIQGIGAAGGNYTPTSATGGRGASITGNFSVTPGETLYLMIGGQGSNAVSSSRGGGGGGGTFISRSSNFTTDLLIAAGGGGGASYTNSAVSNANISNNGNTGHNLSYYGVGAGGTSGNGGSYSSRGSAGAGWNTNGNNSDCGNDRGISPRNGGTIPTGCVSISGGYAGGGAGYVAGGGGGGYSGGSGGDEYGNPSCGGGGGSYNGGTSPVNLANIGTGNGSATISHVVNPITVTQIDGLTSGSVFPIGLDTITYVAVDNSGNTDTCSFTVNRVGDTQAPVIACPANIIIGVCDSTATFSTPIVTDNCSTVGSTTFSYTGAVQTFVVPSGVTSLTITGIGAKGGNYTPTSASGGLGASIQGDFVVTPGETLYLMVGGKGTDATSSGRGGGGGGGTFISRSSGFTTDLMIAAGGGGGAGYSNNTSLNANTSNNGNSGYYLGYYTVGAGGTSGNGGSYSSRGGAGAGWNTNGNNSDCGNDRGISPRNGGTISASCYSIFGGYAGGGGGYPGAGGGGGYAGGSGGDYNWSWGYSSNGGGGGSFNAGTSQVDVANAGNDNGSAVISYSINPLTVTQIAGLTSGSVFPVGVDTIIYVATDVAGNTDTCSFTVTRMQDTIAPVITCPANIVSNCTPVVTFSTPDATDNCGLNGSTSFAYTGTVQTYVVPAGITSLTLQGIGAAGGSYTPNSSAGGLGASITGDFAVTPGETLYIMVGGKGSNATSSNRGGGGGGGTFISRSSGFTTDLMIAAGGGGGAGYTNSSASNANITNNGNAGHNLSYYGVGAGGTSGNGGSYSSRGSAGAGWNTNGNNSDCGNDRGISPRNGGTIPTGCVSISGGYAGGGAGYVAGGGGGGYSGGSGGDNNGNSSCGGGGGSFNGGTSPTNLANINNGDGSVVITYIIPPVLTQIAGLPSGSTFPNGVDTITFVATDLTGNTDTCSFTVTVIPDTIDPVISCPADITMNNTTGNCSRMVTYTFPGGTDNCATPAGSQTFNYTGSVQNFTVPAGVSNVTINGIGAAGGNLTPYGYLGGKGTSITGNFAVTPGETLYLMVGSQGSSSNSSNLGGGGGGGTFISRSSSFTSDLLIAAGGGGGAGYYNNSSLSNATISTNGNSGHSVGYYGSGSGGTSGNGGGSLYPSASGAGWNTNGNSSAGCGSDRGISPRNGGTAPNGCVGIPGGYAGGAAGYNGGGGGGGYSGGGSGDYYGWSGVSASGGGGGSFNGGTSPTNLANIGTGNGTATINWVGDLTITQIAGLASGSVFPVGTTTNTFVATDLFGNTDTCSFTVTINDTQNPTPICQNISVNLDSTGNASITAAQINNGSFDNCAIDTITVSPNTFDCTNYGSNTVVLTVTDIYGNTNSCSSTVTINDNIAPVVQCQNISIDLDANGNATITGSQLDNGSTDACGIASYTANQTTYNCSDLGANTITLTVTDNHGNSATCTSIVTVNDVTDPFFNSCPSNISQNAVTNLCGRVVTYPAPTYGDNCGPVTMTQIDGTTLTSGDIFPVGITQQTYLISDPSGNTDTCSFTVEVVDNQAPLVTGCPTNIMVNTSSTSCNAVVSWTAPTASDNCPGVGLSTTHNPGSTFGLGNTTVVYTAVDASNNVTVCSFMVTVSDNTAPVANAASLPTVTGECSATVSTVPTATDNCSGIINGTTTDPLTYNTEGSHTITWNYDDGNGNISTQTQTVIINDATAPVADVASLPTITGECSAMVNTIPTATDNCSGTITGTTTDSTSYSGEGTYTITWNYDDGNGNISTQTQTVIIDDTNAPLEDVASLPTLNDECSVTLTAPTATDNCEGSITATTTDPTSYNSDGTYVINWIYDDGNGNSSSQFQVVIIDDTNAPVPDVASLATVTGECSVSVIAPTATDSCEGTITATTADPTSYNTQGTYTITWNYNDGNGNTATQSQTVVVDDTNSPIPDVALLATATGECDVTVTPPTATDICAGIITATTTDPTSYNTQGTYTITWNYNDGNGNTATQSQTVIVDDTNAPVADVVTLPIINAECSVNVTAPTATDACEGVITATTLDSTSYNSFGTFTINWSYDDGNGNISTQTQTVVVGDNTAPVADVASLSIVTGECDATVSSVPTATDNCEGVITGTTTDPLFYNVQGTYTITWNYDDGNGNISTQTQTVEIDDTNAPVADVVSLTTVTGQCSATVSTAPTATDNCEGSITGTTTDALSYSAQGTYTITWNYSDGNGNISTQTQTVVVDDTNAPVADVASLSTITGTCSATVSSSPTANDSCSGVITGTTLDPTSYVGGGTYTITWNYDDGNGNISTQTQTVVIDDTDAPVPDVASLPTISDECSVTLTAPTATDGCLGTISGTTSDPTSYDVDGTYTINWTYDDGNGNISTQSQTVIIDDTNAPVPDVASLATITGECSASVIAPTATDSCEGIITGTTTDPTSYNVDGTYTINWSYNDGNGNISTQTQTVVVDDVTSPIANVASLPTITGECNASVTAPTATDNCAGTITATTTDPTSYSTQGTFTINWNYNDGNGNTSSQTQTVVIDDTNAPVADVAILPTISAECSVNVTPPTATDACEGIITATTSDPTSYSAQGTYTITWNYDDGNGNTSSQTQTVVVDDTNAPVADVASLATVSGQCSATVSSTPTATDNCSGTITGTTTDPLTYNVQGTYTVTWNYNDGNGNTSTQTQTVVVDDTNAPVADAASLTTVTGECNATVSSAPTATDNCAGTITGTTTDPTSYSTQGTFTITWNYNDGNGNTSSQTQTVVIDDTNAPVADVASLPTVTGQCNASVTAPTATDNCAGTITATTTDPTSYSTQGTFTVTWNYNDGNGNTSSQTQTVVVDDTNAPVADVASLPTVTGQCNASVTPPTATDNCAGTITATTTDPTSYSTQGTFTITWNYNDGNGNTSSQTQTVVVDDTNAPVADVASLPTVTGQCNASVTAPTATDNCTGTITATTTDPTSYSTQGTFTITWNYNDGNGNTSSQTQTVVVDDTNAPVADVASLPTVTGQCNASVTAPTATDNCTGTITATTTDPTSYSTQGTFTITWNYNDGNGNTSSQTQTVVVDDTNAPVADVASLPTVTGQCNASVTPPTATDNCAGTITATTTDPTSYSTQGIFTITWNYNDGNGNTSSQTQTVVVDDTNAPVADVASLPTVTGQCNASVTPPTATDNCAGTITATTTDPTSYSTQGTFTINWNYNDGNGNTFSQTQTVVVDDTNAPLADVPSLPTVTGECDVTISSAPTATDNCLGTVTGTTTDALTYSTQGTFTITWNFDDGNGNTSSQTQTVLVDDTQAPVADLSSLPTVTGTCNATVTTVPTATDNCSGSINGTTSDPLTYTVAGTYTVIWNFDDGNGNTSTQEQIVTVTDNVAPVTDVIFLQNVVGNCSVSVGTVPTATDNCAGSISGTTSDPLTYDQPGTYFIIWTFDDGNGNIETQNQVVIVNECLAIEENNTDINATVYPNPSNGIFTLSLTEMPRGPIELRLVTTLGQLLYAGTLQSENQTFDFSNLAAATYYLQIITPNGSLTKQVIITQRY